MSSQMHAVLIVSDDRSSRRQLAKVLRHGGFEAKAVEHFDGASRVLRRQPFDAIVATELARIDLPDLVRELRAQTELPILVVSTDADERTKVSALEAGADDYLTEPYGVEELLARLRATMRRFVRSTEDAPVVTDDFIVFVRDRRFVMCDGTEAHLTETEWKVLEVLLRHPGHLVTRSDLLRAVWGPDAVDKTNYLRVHMVSIRRKVEPDPSRPRYFVTAPGLGIRFVPTPPDVRSSIS